MRLIAGVGLLASAIMQMTGSAAADAACDFVYSDAIINEVVIPALKERHGEYYKFYNWETPYYEEKNGRIMVYLGSFKDIDGHTLMSEMTTVIELDKCTGKLLKIYEVWG